MIKEVLNPGIIGIPGGRRTVFPDWWFNIRPSNTEPYLRLLAEAKTEALLDEKVKLVEAILQPFLQDQ